MSQRHPTPPGRSIVPASLERNLVLILFNYIAGKIDLLDLLPFKSTES
jgi:hypothetical protein